MRAGTEYVLFLHFQVNPTEIGRRPQDVQLLDGETPLLELDRTVTIYPRPREFIRLLDRARCALRRPQSRP